MSLTKVTYSMIDSAARNVIDYGADNTGVDDSTAAFQAAIDDGSLTYIPSGTYKITDTIYVPANHQVFGDGQQTRINATIAAGDYVFYCGDSVVALNYGIVLRDMNIVLVTSLSKGVMLFATCAAQILNARVQGENVGNLGTGFTIDGGDVSSFFNYFQNCHTSHLEVGFDIIETGSSYATQQIFIDCSCFGDYSSGYLTSIGFNFAATPAGVDSCIFGGSVENLGIGVNLTSMTGITFNGLRFETCNLDINSDIYTSDCSFIACKNILTTTNFPSAADGYGNNSIIACTGTFGKNNYIESQTTFYARAAASLPIKIIAYPAQTEALLRTTDSSGNTLCELQADGSILIAGAASAGAAGTVTLGSTTQTTVGAAGGATALPATPLGYRIDYIAGVKVVTPYYAAS